MLLPTLITLHLAINTLAAPGVEHFDAGRENQSGLSFSPDGRTAWWSAWDGRWGQEAGPRKIYTSHWTSGEWSAPAPAAFSSEFDDDDPFVSSDGRWLYFVSTRPEVAGGSETEGDIWRYELGAPNRLERLGVNSDAAEYSPVVTESGALYFASAREGGYGRGDIYRAAAGDGEFAEPVALGPALNHPTGEWNLWVAPDEREIIIEASSRPENVSTPGDLYYSWQTAAGWAPAMPLSELNGEGSELMPRLHPGGEVLYYTTAPIDGHARIASTNWPQLRSTLRARHAPSLLIANRSSHDVAVVDLELGEVVQRVATGEGPHLLSNLEAGKVLATGYGVFPEPHDGPVSSRPPFVEQLNSRVTLIDAATFESEMTAVLDGCARPHASWLVGMRGFVVCEDEARVLEIDLADGTAVGAFETGQAGSHVIVFEPVSRKLSVSNTESGSVTLVDVDSGETAVVPLGRGSEGALVVDGHIWVGNGMEGTLSVVDPLAAEEIHRSERICGFPIALGARATGPAWLACFGSSELVALNRHDFAPLRRISLADAPLNIVVHPTRDLAYVSLPRANAVEEVDLHTGEAIRRIPVGIEPDGLRWAAGAGDLRYHPPEE